MTVPFPKPKRNNPAKMSEKLIGQVKWFNSKAGYGFITALEGDMKSRDIFVHYSSIMVKDDDKYKYLVQGECVEFELSTPTRGEHEFIAVAVTGVRGGELMCTIRKQNTDKRSGEQRTETYSPRVYKTPDETKPKTKRFTPKK
jgi:CspA family cold shock protein